MEKRRFRDLRGTLTHPCGYRGEGGGRASWGTGDPGGDSVRNPGTGLKLQETDTSKQLQFKASAAGRESDLSPPSRLAGPRCGVPLAKPAFQPQELAYVEERRLEITRRKEKATRNVDLLSVGARVAPVGS